MLIQRTLILLAVLTVLGCSGLSSLILQNRTGTTLTGRISMEEAGEKGRKESVDFSLRPGDDVETLRWFSSAPDSITIEFDSGVRRRFGQNEYSPGMKTGTSGGAYYFLEIDQGGFRFKDPSQFDRFRRNPIYYIPCAAGFIFLAWMLVRGMRRTKR